MQVIPFNTGRSSGSSAFTSTAPATPEELAYLETLGLAADLPALGKPSPVVQPPAPLVDRATYEADLIQRIITTVGDTDTDVTEAAAAVLNFKGYKNVPDWMLHLAGNQLFERWLFRTRDPQKNLVESIKTAQAAYETVDNDVDKRVIFTAMVGNNQSWNDKEYRNAVLDPNSLEWYNTLYSIGAGRGIVAADYGPSTYIDEPVRKAPVPNYADLKAITFIDVIKLRVLVSPVTATGGFLSWKDRNALGPASVQPIIDGLWFVNAQEATAAADAAFQKYTVALDAYNEREKYRVARAQALRAHRRGQLPRIIPGNRFPLYGSLAKKPAPIVRPGLIAPGRPTPSTPAYAKAFFKKPASGGSADAEAQAAAEAAAKAAAEAEAAALAEGGAGGAGGSSDANVVVETGDIVINTPPAAPEEKSGAGKLLLIVALAGGAYWLYNRNKQQ